MELIILNNNSSLVSAGDEEKDELVLEAFCKHALSDQFCDDNGNSIPPENIYRVFIGRRCFLSICGYIMKNTPTDKNILKTIYSDIGMRVLSKQFAEKFFDFRKKYPQKRINEFPYRIVIFDDILIYGRTFSGLLSACENIFADTYKELQNDPDRHTKEELYSIFLSFVMIDTEYKNKSSNLLKSRYRKCIIPKNNDSEPKEWRKVSYEISESMFKSDIPNSPFIPAVRFTNECPYSKISDAFSKSRNNGSLNDFKIDINSYRGRKLYNYIAAFSENDELKFVFTIRCTEKHLIPFVFLPSLDEFQFDRIKNSFSEKLPHYSEILNKKKSEWSKKQLNVVYAELINMLITTAFLRSFLDELGDKDIVYNLLKNNTKDIMNYNYAHDKEIEEILEYLLNYENNAVFSLTELKNLLSDIIGTEKCIFKGISDIKKDDNSDKSDDIIQKTERKLEKVVFDYGIASEKDAYTMLKSYLSPSSTFIDYFSFPLNNMVGNFLRKIYAHENSWTRCNVSLNNVFSYLLQMIDEGCLTLTVVKNGGKYIQCLKTGSQAMNMLMYRYAEYLPLLNEIQLRCIRQGTNTLSGLYYEFKYFFEVCRDYGKNNNFNTDKIENIYKSFRRQIFHIVYKLHDSGQKCMDYMYLVDKKLKDMKAKLDPEEYIEMWKKLYMKIVY